jgi:hypothetical protein
MQKPAEKTILKKRSLRKSTATALRMKLLSWRKRGWLRPCGEKQRGERGENEQRTDWRP